MLRPPLRQATRYERKGTIPLSKGIYLLGLRGKIVKSYRESLSFCESLLFMCVLLALIMPLRC